ncbi:MAG: hypothetical protein NC084_02950 [Bacteroides sp.]|nr:hypothetical protein [Eubacterium sp.]MCM1417474.1 hypothetical protein [Roseburia sp.]MCM1461654.1 hypothetical protein [Bacteroides sp.]
MTKKRKFAVPLIAALILGGCNAAAPVLETETAPPTQSEATEPLLSQKEETSAPKEEASAAPEEGNGSLDTISFQKLMKTPLSFEDGVLDYFWIPETLNWSTVRYASETELYLTDCSPKFRSSCRELGENALADAKKLSTVEGWYGMSGVYFDDPLLKIGAIENENEIPVESVGTVCNLYFNEPRVFRGFLRRTVDGAECILDPAYMDEIPLLSDSERDLTFTVNGETMIADTIALTFEGSTSEPIDDAIGEAYVYAEFSFTDLEINYNTGSGYQNRGYFLTDVKLLTEDTASVLRGDYIFEQEYDPADEASLLYQGLTEGFASLRDEKTCGIVLLDLDFDGSPEVLVSRAVYEEDAKFFSHTDVDVYRFENGEFTYLDTIRSIARRADGETSGSSAYLGLKTLADGSRAWFAMTDEEITDEEKGGHLESGKLFRLENGKIREEEIFSLWQDLDRGETTTYFGDEAVTLPTDWEGSNYETPWGIIERYYTYDFYYSVKNLYCADIEEKFFLYSDWLIPITSYNNGSRSFGTEFLSPSARDISIQLGRLTDSYYYGDYSAGDGGYVYDFHEIAAMKPVIYLYPEEETEVAVSVDFPSGGGLTCTYPEYRDGWRVTALPDGTLFDEDGNEYYCLYWEGEGLPLPDMTEGWCVPGEDTADFLREKLLEIGLTAREANEMIIYWLPQMRGNPYNLISFRFEDYSRAAPLTVSPAPDTVIRVFMTYTPAEEWVELSPQALSYIERNGFTLVEWGGCEIS